VKAYCASQITDTIGRNAAVEFRTIHQTTKEAYLYRTIFHKLVITNGGSDSLENGYQDGKRMRTKRKEQCTYLEQRRLPTNK
jgi:hypothetical protein